MSKQAILERERRWAVPVLIASVLALVLMISDPLLESGIEFQEDASEGENLETFDENSGLLLFAFSLRALGTLLLVVPLFFLFRAAQARSEAVRPAMIGVTIAGPLFYAVSIILQWAGVDAAAGDFVAGGECADIADVDEQDECIDDLIADNGLFQAFQGLELAGRLGVLAALFYSGLHAMRAGLLTRFLGSLGMALAVSILLLGPFGLLAVAAWFIAVSLMAVDRWPGGRPPAWDEARAIPWPKPGEEPPEPPGGKAIEGSAEGVPAGADAEGSGAAPATPRRKRKRRG